MTNRKPPCDRECPERNGKCHATCEKYLAFAKLCEEDRAARFKEKQERSYGFNPKRYMASQKKKWEKRK